MVSMSVISVGDKCFITLFRLVGIRGIETSEDQLEKIVKDLISKGEYKAIIISEKNAMKVKRIREELLRTGQIFPIFIIVPGPEGPLGERIKEIHSLITQAVGVKLKLE